jgi:Ta0938
LKRNYPGCAICDSTWGDVWAEVDGERMFFCCELCVIQFRELVQRIHRETGWTRLDAVEIHGDRRGRTCVATAGARSVRVQVTFTTEGQLLKFETLVASSPSR